MKRIILPVFIASLFLVIASCSREPVENLPDATPPQFEFDQPDGGNVRTNATFSGKVLDESGVLSATVRIGSDGAEIPLSLGFSGDFRYSVILDYTNGLPVIFRATDISNNSVTVTNRYSVVDPLYGVWNIDVTLHGVNWGIDSSKPLTVAVLKRTNNSTNIVDFLDGGMWDYDNQLIRTSTTTHFATVFSNIATNDSPNGDSGYDLLIYRDDNTNERYDVDSDFMITFNEIPIDGLSVYESVYGMFLATGTLTLPYTVNNQLYALIALDYIYSGENATLYGFGGGKVASASSTINYNLAVNTATAMQIGAFVDTDGDGNPTEAGDFMGFYGSTDSMKGMPPFFKNVTIATNGPNVYNIQLYTNKGSTF